MFGRRNKVTSTTGSAGQADAPDSPPLDEKGRRAVISTRNLITRFGSQTVLSGVDLDIYEGETLVVMGGSGCGKSTLLRCLIGALPVDQGAVSMLGRDLSVLGEQELDETRLKFGILFQSGALYNSMTIGENVALPLREHTDLAPEVIDIQGKMQLERVGLREHADKLPSQISGGMKKRAGLARAMALDPRILFYDEPSAGLDPVTSAEIDRLIIHLSRGLGVTSVVVTHEMDSAFTIADRMVMLDKGVVLKIEKRDWFDRLRHLPADQAADLSETERVIRQFLRGDAEGPITERRSASNYAEDLLGGAKAAPMPSVEATRPTP
ncbi:MAG: ABC transporter ATP-binding protein [bacterium]